MEQFETRFKQVDVFPMVKHYMDELKLFKLFDKYVPSPDDCLINHAQGLCVITANIICDNKPLYKVKEWLSKYSDGIGNDQVEADLFNDDRLARTLSALFESDRHSLMTEVSSNAISVHKLMTDEIHNDSTTVTFLGNYDVQHQEAVKLKYGHNKDFRPDCKQIVFGLNITSDGHVPLTFNLHDGNTTDDVTHIPNWNGLRALIHKEDFIYVADCKLCSNDNLDHIAQNGGYFITVVPKGRKEVKKFINHLRTNKVKWEPAYKTQSSRKKDVINVFKTYEAGSTLNGYRMIWIHSSKKQEDDKYRRMAKIKKATASLEELQSKLNAYHLKTKKEIKSAVNKICSGISGFFKIRILTERKQIKIKVSPGRPSLSSVYKNKWEFTYHLDWKLNDEAIAEASKTDGIFPLVTNTELKAAEVLRKYKTQPFLEKRMYTKKTILEVAPVFLKKTERIEAILFLYFVALMIVSLIERRIRKNMAYEKIEKLPILPQGMNTKTPTWNNIRYFFRDIHFSEIIRDGLCIQAIVKGMTELHKKVNQLLDVPDSIYEKLSSNWWQFRYT